MGRGKAVTVGAQTFQTMEEFKVFVRKLLYDLDQGAVVQEPHHSFLCQLVLRHKEAAEKIGTGIKHFKVLTNTNYGGKNRCFYLFRVDGTHTDFSYQKCIATPTPWQEYNDALRTAVVDQIMAARDVAFGRSEEILCPIKNILITKSACHVDHVAPDTFATLVERFNDEEWIHEQIPPSTGGGDNACGRRLMDKGLEARWRYFHRAHARLRVISKEAHREVTVG